MLAALADVPAADSLADALLALVDAALAESAEFDSAVSALVSAVSALVLAVVAETLAFCDAVEAVPAEVA